MIMRRQGFSFCHNKGIFHNKKQITPTSLVPAGVIVVVKDSTLIKSTGGRILGETGPLTDILGGTRKTGYSIRPLNNTQLAYDLVRAQ